ITDKNGPVVAVVAVKEGDELMLMAEKGKVIRTKIDDVRETGRSAVGVYLMDLEADDRIVSVVVGQPGDFLLTVCEKGVGKRSQIDEYRKTATQRAKGVINVKITDKNGPVVAVVAVKEGDELMLMAEKGKVIRTRMEDVRETGRGAVGVYLMDLADDDKVVSVAKIAKEDAAAAHEQAAALKAEKQEERERDGNGSGRRKKEEGENGDGAQASVPPPGDKPQPLTDSLKELADRAEKQAEEREKDNDEPEENDVKK
ncbi:MAG TPA: DNA gyrase C-terminal beta-propeller domain-containing protein, partial [Planctomycetota bacterium]|nr:DNA gyrase C-terminal beta-propeller domain-containing protein [Planctomycetota bacterium]